MPAVVDREKCSGCGACVDVCPVEGISMDGDVAIVNDENCIDCGACVGECPNEAITLPA